MPSYTYDNSAQSINFDVACTEVRLNVNKYPKHIQKLSKNHDWNAVLVMEKFNANTDIITSSNDAHVPWIAERPMFYQKD